MDKEKMFSSSLPKVFLSVGFALSLSACSNEKELQATLEGNREISAATQFLNQNQPPVTNTETCSVSYQKAHPEIAAAQRAMMDLYTLQPAINLDALGQQQMLLSLGLDDNDTVINTAIQNLQKNLDVKVPLDTSLQPLFHTLRLRKRTLNQALADAKNGNFTGLTAIYKQVQPKWGNYFAGCYGLIQKGLIKNNTFSYTLHSTMPQPTAQTCSADYIKAHPELVKDPGKADPDRDKKMMEQMNFWAGCKNFFPLVENFPAPSQETCSGGEMSNSYVIAHPEIASSAAFFMKRKLDNNEPLPPSLKSLLIGCAQLK